MLAAMRRARAGIELAAIAVLLVGHGVAASGCGGSDPGPGSAASIAQWTETEGQDTTPETRTIGAQGEVTSSAPPSRTIGGSGDARIVRRGARVDARFHDAELREAMRLLAEVAGVDVVIDEAVRGRVTLDLEDVAPIDAMDAIARAHGAVLEQSGRTILVRAAR